MADPLGMSVASSFLGPPLTELSSSSRPVEVKIQYDESGVWREMKLPVSSRNTTRRVLEKVTASLCARANKRAADPSRAAESRAAYEAMSSGFKAGADGFALVAAPDTSVEAAPVRAGEDTLIHTPLLSAFGTDQPKLRLVPLSGLPEPKGIPGAGDSNQPPPGQSPGPGADPRGRIPTPPARVASPVDPTGVPLPPSTHVSVLASDTRERRKSNVGPLGFVLDPGGQDSKRVQEARTLAIEAALSCQQMLAETVESGVNIAGEAHRLMQAARKAQIKAERERQASEELASQLRRRVDEISHDLERVQGDITRDLQRVTEERDRALRELEEERRKPPVVVHPIPPPTGVAATQTNPGELPLAVGLRQRKVSNLVDPGALMAELRVLRSRRRVADPRVRGLVEQAAAAAALRPALPPPLQSWSRHSGSGLGPRPDGDPELLRLWDAAERDMRAHMEVVDTWRRRTEHMRHGWLAEAGKVERLLGLVAQLGVARELSEAGLDEQLEEDATMLSRAVHRRIDAEMRVADEESAELHAHAQWCLQRLAEDGPEGRTAASAVESLWQREGAWAERVRVLEEENNLLAQRVALVEEQGGLRGVAEARVLAARVVQLEEDLSRERDLRVQYAMQSNSQNPMSFPQQHPQTFSSPGGVGA
eukprot:Hpha_TRINITY_DN34239_c0_g1::TRINITY_DN34239_c0_g1_i1::g.34382::m.34382